MHMRTRARLSTGDKSGALNYRRLGRGEPLVLLHGLGMRWQWWTPCLDALAERHELVLLDLPGFGGSAPFPPERPRTPVAITDAVAARLAELGLDRPHVAGLSLGGLVAPELAPRGGVRWVPAVSPAGFTAPGWERRLFAAELRLTAAVLGRVVEHVEPLVAHGAIRAVLMGHLARHGARVPPSELAAAVRAQFRSDFDRTAAALVPSTFTGGEDIAVPVTIAWGTRDFLLPPWQARRALRAIPGARHVPLRGCGHIPFYDDPGAVARVVLETTAAH